MDQPSSAPPKGARVVPPPSRRSRRALIFFAVLGVVLALGSGGLYVYKGPDGTSGAAVPQTGPEDAVRVFLSAVFLANDASRLAGVVCGSWDPQNAYLRTRAEITTGATVSSWDDVRLIMNQGGRASVSARLGVRPPGGFQPAYAQWRFSVVDEAGWRVCEARPFVN